MSGSPSSEPVWDVIARKRRERDRLDQEIKAGTPEAIQQARAAGVPMKRLASQWGVTEQWIYMQVPARPKNGE